MKRIDPDRVQRDEEIDDYKIDTCQSTCYSVSKGGMGSDKCQFCRIRVGWTETEIYCTKND